MYYKKYESERIYMSPVNLDDYKLFAKWLNDESLASGLGNFNFNFSEINEKEWLENKCKSGEHNYVIIRKEDNKIIGSYGLEIKDNVSRRIHIGGFIGEKEDRGKGYGTEALKLLTKYCFDVLNAESLFSGIYAFNEASLKSCLKAGYTVAGKFRDAYYYNGKFHDEIMIEITRKDFYK